MTDQATGQDATKTALVRSLDAQRRHILGILEGLSDDQLREPMLPSKWSCLGLLQHLALDVEHYWFSCIVGGESLEFFAEGGDDATYFWTVRDGTTAQSVLERYRTEIEASDAVLAAAALDAPPAQRDGWWGDWDVSDVRFILLHVIAETACHAGHLDAARELIDGRQWVVL